MRIGSTALYLGFHMHSIVSTYIRMLTQIPQDALALCCNLLISTVLNWGSSVLG